MRMVWLLYTRHEFPFSALVIAGFYIGEYRMRELWMGETAPILFFIAGIRLASHPMWKKDEE